jgi:hypothetical protein
MRLLFYVRVIPAARRWPRAGHNLGSDGDVQSAIEARQNPRAIAVMREAGASQASTRLRRDARLGRPIITVCSRRRAVSVLPPGTRKEHWPEDPAKATRLKRPLWRCSVRAGRHPPTGRSPTVASHRAERRSSYERSNDDRPAGVQASLGCTHGVLSAISPSGYSWHLAGRAGAPLSGGFQAVGSWSLRASTCPSPCSSGSIIPML